MQRRHLGAVYPEDGAEAGIGGAIEVAVVAGDQDGGIAELGVRGTDKVLHVFVVEKSRLKDAGDVKVLFSAGGGNGIHGAVLLIVGVAGDAVKVAVGTLASLRDGVAGGGAGALRQ